MVRLYLPGSYRPDSDLGLDRDQAHYLFNVMRLGVGAKVEVFNGQDGAWSAEVAEAGKRGGRLRLLHQVTPQRDPPDLWLLFAPIKKARTDFIVEKATELGARRICPVVTDFTNAERLRQDRLQAHAVEAAEQCGGTFVPEVAPLAKLRPTVETLGDRRLFFCDEALAGAASPWEARGPAAILIGPEGGFSPQERTWLRGLPSAQALSLGPRILRADTAAVAALALWQQALGDWAAP